MISITLFASAFVHAASVGVFGTPAPVAGPETGQSGGVERTGQVLFVGSGDSLSAYDVADPLQPRLLSTLGGFDAVRQLRVQDGFVYVVSRETGLRIVDARDPKKMRIRSRYDSVEFATGVEVAGPVAFLSERINGVEAVDVRDPDRPAHIAIRKTGESQSCRYKDGFLYSGEWGVGEVTVFDAHDMRNFRSLGRVPLGGFGDGVDLADGFLYCSTGHDARHRDLKGEEAKGRGRGLDIFRLADPSAPQHVARVDFPRFLPKDRDFWTPRAANGFVFCADSHNGLFAVDARDPAAAKVVDRLCVPMPSRPDLDSCCAASLAIGDGCLYVLFVPGGLHVVPVKGVKPPVREQGHPPAHPDYRETYPTEAAAFAVYRPAAPGQARRVQLDGDVAYVAFGDAGLHVLRLTDEGFERLGQLPGGHQVNDCLLMDGKLVTAEGRDGFAVYVRKGAGGFREIARRANSGAGGSVAFWLAQLDDRLVALSGRSGGFGVFRLDDFAAAKPLATFSGSCNWDRYTPERAIGGRYPLFIPYTGFNWVDLGGARPKSKWTRFPRSEIGAQTNGIVDFGGRFLLTVGDGYRWVETDGTMGPVIRPQGMRPGIPRTDGRRVALTNRSGRFVQMWDFADPARPVKVREDRISGNPDLASFWRGRMVIPAGHQGVLLEGRRGE